MVDVLRLRDYCAIDQVRLTRDIKVKIDYILLITKNGQRTRRTLAPRDKHTSVLCIVTEVSKVTNDLTTAPKTNRIVDYIRYTQNV